MVSPFMPKFPTAHFNSKLSGTFASPTASTVPQRSGEPCSRGGFNQGKVDRRMVCKMQHFQVSRGALLEAGEGKTSLNQEDTYDLQWLLCPWHSQWSVTTIPCLLFQKRMQQIMLQCFLAAKHKLDRKLGYFDLIGCDFLIDENFKVWIHITKY